MREDIFTFHTERGAPFAVSMCGTSYCDGSYCIYRKESTVYVMEYVISGCGKVEENGRSAVACAGDVYFLRRGRRHYYRSDAKEPWVKLWFNFTGEAVDKLCECYGVDSELVFHAPELRPLFEEVLEIGGSTHDYKQVSDKVAVAFLKILQGLSQLTERKSARLGVAERLRRYIDEATDFGENLDDIAKQLGCTKSHAIREFRAVYGTTPYEYVQKRRFGLAKSLLRSSAMSVTEISERLGFYDVHYFSGAFKRRVGVTPLEYRRS